MDFSFTSLSQMMAEMEAGGREGEGPVGDAFSLKLAQLHALPEQERDKDLNAMLAVQQYVETEVVAAMV
jgi:hypothetical protein